MLVNLPNGKTVDMHFDDYLRMGMEGYQYLVAQNIGMDIEYPFFASILYKQGWDKDEEEEDEANEGEEGNDYFEFIEE